MKSKRLGKKPVLNKKTVANLKDKEMKKVNGGTNDYTIPRHFCINTG